MTRRAIALLLLASACAPPRGEDRLADAATAESPRAVPPAVSPAAPLAATTTAPPPEAAAPRIHYLSVPDLHEDAGEGDGLDAKFHLRLWRGEDTEPRCRWDYFLWRDAACVESLESHGNTGSVWRRDASGRLTSFERSFHVERRVVEYNSGDLVALGVAPDWAAASSLMDPAELGTRLAKAGTGTLAGRATETYRGVSAGAAGATTLEVVWIPSLRIPARIERRTATDTLLVELRSAAPRGSARWPRPRSAAYDRVDFADIGDRPTDLFLRRFAAGDGSFGCRH